MSIKDDEGRAVTRRSEPNTPDVTLAFVDWLQKTRRGSWLHLIYDVGALQDIRLWDFGEDGGFYHWYKTQYESFGHTQHEYPASKDHSTSYYDEGELPLHRPSPSNFTKAKAEYPLRHTRRIFTCPRCSGSGDVECPKCNGKGRCPNCKGRGRTGSGNDAKKCGSCGGSGKCPKCGGTGKVRCEKCKGEGQLLSYTSKDYRWWHKTDDKQSLSPAVDRSPVRGLMKKARSKEGSIEVSGCSEDEVLRATGVINDRIRDLIQLAEADRRALEREIEGRSGSILFRSNRLEYIPLSYLNMFAGSKYGQFFAAGTEQYYKDYHPPMPLSVWKIAGWLGLVGLITSLVLNGYGFLGLWPLVALLAVSGGVIGGSSWKAVRELRQPAPRQWFVFDDSAHGAWQFAHALAQAISRAHVAYVADPWFTALLEPPKPDTAKSRHSFTYTVRHHHQSDSPRKTEIVVVGNRAQKQYSQKVASLIQSADRLTWIAGERSAAELDQVIAETIDRLPAERRTSVEVSVVSDERAEPILPEQFGRVLDKVGAERFSVLAIPVRQMCDEALSGFVSEEADENFQRLIEHSGLRSAAPVLEPSVEQVNLELTPGDDSPRREDGADEPRPEPGAEHAPKT